MRLTSTLLALLLIAGTAILASCGASNAEILSQARSVEVSLMRYLPTGMVDWIHAEAGDLASGRSNEEIVRQQAAGHVTGEDPDGHGTEVLTFFVMMDAVRILDKGFVNNQKRTEAIGKAKAGIDGLIGTVNGDLSNNSGKDDSDPCAFGSYEPLLNELASSLRQSETWITLSVREPLDVGDLRALIRDLEHMKDTMGELGEMNQLRLQAYDDRRSQIINAISRIQKKASETNSSIIQNMK